VLAVTGLGKNLGEAISKSIKAAEEIRYDGKYFRSDIGLDLKELGQLRTFIFEKKIAAWHVQDVERMVTWLDATTTAIAAQVVATS